MNSDLKVLIKVFFDLIFIFLSSFIASSIFYGEFIHFSKSLIFLFVFNSLTIIPIIFYLKSYFDLSRYFNVKNTIYIFFGVSVSFLSQIIFILILQAFNFDFTKTALIFFKYQNIFLIHFIFFLLTINFRILLRTLLNISDIKKNKITENACLIYGAGNSGVASIKYITEIKNYNPIGFIDDDANKIGRYINNIPIISFSSIDQFIKKNKLKKIFICLPSASSFKINEIAQRLSLFKIDYEEIKSFNNDENKLSSYEFKKSIINFNKEDSKKSIYRHKKILITGAAGTIGEELCFQIIKEEPTELILVDSNELGISNLIQKLQNLNITNVKVTTLLINLCMFSSIQKVVRFNKPDFIFHAAAYKHVEIVEQNPINAIYNNITSLINILEASKDLVNLNFVFISTDKAVEPVNYMGKSKRLGEIITNFSNKIFKNQNKYFSVRFGNVIGSSGSLIPKIQNQLKNNEEITVTDKNATRYFMTISDAINLTLYAVSLNKTNEIIVLNMGDPINIYDLVKKIIQNSGKTNNSNKIKITGLRKGEKLHEKLYNEKLTKPHLNNLFFIETIPEKIDSQKFKEITQNLNQSLKENNLELIDGIFEKI